MSLRADSHDFPSAPQQAKSWAYQPVVRPEAHAVAEVGKVRTLIDRFILQRLEAEKLSLSAEADKRTLLRRAKFDLLGLPPTPEEIEQFLADDSPRAYEKLLDRLLASPHYGERWGRIWLDVVRYADSAGYNADPVRPLAYQYRDYVIQALNADTPYDRFIQEQLAGDELFPESKAALIATGFNRLPPDESNASNVPLARQDMLNDLTAGVGSIFLAQSFGCAQCHDHKFDPITQKDFYRLQAFFAGVIPVETMTVAPSSEQVEFEKRAEDWLAATDALRNELHLLEANARADSWKEKRLRFPESVWQALATPRERRTALQHQYAFYAERQVTPTAKEVNAGLSKEQRERRKELHAELERREKERPQPPLAVSLMGSADGSEIPTTHMLAGGSYNKPLDEVAPGFPAYLSASTAAELPAAIVPPRPGVSGRRAALARWITDPQNPLTARVLVNRLWQGHFGKGLAENANDFGVQSSPPTHPELLDWLAAEFVSPTVALEGDATSPAQQAWGLKRMHKLIMSSTVYRQASATGDTNANRDVEQLALAEQLYGSYPRRRLEAESIRDGMLAVSGLLNGELYGPAVMPEMPARFSARESWKVSPTAERRRRSIYILAKRNLPYPMLDAFDLPDMHESCARRQITTTGPQALMLLNSEMILEYAQAFAGRLLAMNPNAEPDRLVADAYILAFGRSPMPAETAAASEFLASQQAITSAKMSGGEPILLSRGMPKFLDPALSAAIVDFCHALINANEFVYVD